MTLADSVTIRSAVPDDADRLARLQLDVWEDAYGDLMPAAVFEERRATIDGRVERWRGILAGAGATSSTTVAQFAGELIGFASIGPPRTQGVEVDEELWALYVAAPWWGRQVGHALLASTLADRPAYLWVLRGNDRAVAFYEKHGFRQDGTTRADEHGTEVRMVRLS